MYPEYIRQRPCGCVIACLLMIFARHGVTGEALTEEGLAERLGLRVPPENAAVYGRNFVMPTPPSGGYGTRINEPSFSLERLFEKERLPLSVRFRLSSTLPTAESLRSVLKKNAGMNDVMVCFESNPGEGHVRLLESLQNSSVCMIDPGLSLVDPGAGFHVVEPLEKLHGLIRARGDKNYGGLWIIKKQAIKDSVRLPRP